MHSHAVENLHLVILGCTVIGPEELALIEQILESRCRLLVLATSLPPIVMRGLFLHGADDVADKPYNAEHLFELIQEAFEKSTPRDSYQVVRREGAS